MTWPKKQRHLRPIIEVNKKAKFDFIGITYDHTSGELELFALADEREIRLFRRTVGDSYVDVWRIVRS